jgi:mannosyltransferase
MSSFDALSRLPASAGPGFRAVAVTGLVLVAGAVRLAALERHSFWYDEAVSVELARHDVIDLLAGRARDLGNPPLYPVLLHLWMRLFGDQDAAVRALSAVLGVITVPLVFLLARRILPPTAALISALLLALSPFHLQMAQEARAYTLLTLTGVLSVTALLRALERPSARFWWLAHAMATAAMLLSHYFGFFLAAAQVVYVIAVHRRVLLHAAASFSLAALGFAFWLPSLFAQLGTEGNLARSAESWHLHLAATPLIFGVGSALVWKDNATTLRLLTGALASIAFSAAALAGLWSLRRRRAGLLLLLWLALPVALPALISIVASPLYNARYVILASVPFYLLAAAGLVALPRAAWLAASVLIAVATVSAQASYFRDTAKHQWRSAVAFVEQELQEDDILLFAADHNETAWAHYARRSAPRVRLLLPSPGFPNDRLWGVMEKGAPAADVTDRVLTRARAWLVLSDAQPQAAARIHRFFEGWNATHSARLRGIELQLYERR